LENIGKRFNLNPCKDEFTPIIKYKGSYNNDFKIKEIILPKNYVDLILSSVNQEQEARLGYSISI
jgi:hypothetical protein